MSDRLNSGGPNLTRHGSAAWCHGWPFMKFITELAKLEKFTALVPLNEKMLLQREYEEIVLRYFAYLNNLPKFQKSVEDFLNC